MRYHIDPVARSPFDDAKNFFPLLGRHQHSLARAAADIEAVDALLKVEFNQLLQRLFVDGVIRIERGEQSGKNSLHLKLSLFVKRIAAADIANAAPDIVGAALKIDGAAVDEIRYRVHILFVKPSRGDGGGAEPYAAGDKGLLGVVGHGIFVGGDIHLVEPVLKLLARNAERAQIDKDKVVIRAARHEPNSP